MILILKEYSISNKRIVLLYGFFIIQSFCLLQFKPLYRRVFKTFDGTRLHTQQLKLFSCIGFYLARLGNVVELTTLNKKARNHLFTQEVE